MTDDGSDSSVSGEKRTIQFPESGWTRTPKVFDWLDWGTEALIAASIIFSPWAFGTTQPWSIAVMNWVGYLVGVLLAGKWAVRIICRYRPHRWGYTDSAKSWRVGLSRVMTGVMAFLTAALLLYCFVHAMNARAAFKDGFGYFEYFDNYNKSLPHSYDSPRSWQAFFSYLALACYFWGLRDWLLGKTRVERHAFMAGEDDKSGAQSRRGPLVIPVRLKRLLWYISANAAVLSLEAIVQRLDGGNKLLWLVEPRINKTNISQFGPYAYRSNAAQYLNLAWPVCLGFWWASQRSFSENFRRTARMGQGAHLVLLPMAVLIAVGPLIATSRGGVLVSLVGVICSILLFVFFSQRTNLATKFGMIVLFSIILGLSGWLGWEPLQKRLSAPVIKYATDTDEDYSTDVTISSTFTVPEAGSRQTLYINVIAPLQTVFHCPDSILGRIVQGKLEVYLVGRSTGDKRIKIVDGFVDKYAGQDVNVVWVKTGDDLVIYANGELLETTEGTQGTPPDWSARVGVSFTWTGYGNSPKFNGGYLLQTTIYNTAQTPDDLAVYASVPDLARENGLIFTKDFSEGKIGLFVNSDSSGREELFKIAERMHADYPLFGTGPGTFLNVNSVYLENSYQGWQGYVHDDYRETLATFGWVGFSMILALLLIVLLHWWIGAGMTAYFPFAAMFFIALCGCLAHAKFDFPFQVYSILHLFIINCGILVSCARRV